ncbi:uncharacterized protein LOC135485994 [Lineus longissimus]|uniref:uncharacterized protein LOC135485994 n=1 Tax=Lineus longissimus TaxID=88925 RepID=UPI00315DF5BE
MAAFLLLWMGVFASFIDLQVLAAAPVECAEYTERIGQCAKGTKLATQALTNLDACKTNCGMNPACRGFNSVPGLLSLSCDLMSEQCEDGELLASSNSKVYTKTCPQGPLSNYNLRKGDCVRNDIKKLTVDVTALGCAQECDSLPECKAFLYKIDPTIHCWLKNNECPVLSVFPALMYQHFYFYTKLAVPLFTTTTPATNPTTPGPNLALKKPAGQSSVYAGHSASLAVDGDRNPVHDDGSCSHMGNTVDPWWYVDLGTEISVGTVVIANRQQSFERLANFDVKLSNTAPPDGLSGATVCFHQDKPALDGEVLQIPCRGSGRYVIVQTMRTGLLSLCEVEVYEDLDATTVVPVEPNTATAATTTKPTTTKPITVAVPNYSHLTGDCTESNLKELTVDVTINGCAEECDRMPDCKSFVYKALPSPSCQLKSSTCPTLTQVPESAGATHFYRKIEEVPNYSVRIGDCPGYDIKQLTTDVTRESCAEECDSLPECKSFLYELLPTLKCYLKSSECPILKPAPISFGIVHFYTKEEPTTTASLTAVTTEIPSPSPTTANFFDSPWWILLGPTNETNPENLKELSLSESNTNMTSGPEGLNAWTFGGEAPNTRSSVRVNSNGVFDFGDDSWTLATFLNPESLKDGSIVEWEGDVQNTNGNQLGIKDGKLQTTLVKLDGTETTYPFKAPSLNTWQLVGVSYDKETGALHMWIDDQISKEDVGKVTTDMKGDLVIGNRPNGPDGMEQLKGKLAGMTIVNYAITPPVETAELRRRIIGTARPAAGDLIVDEWNNKTALIAGLVCGLLLLLLLVLLIICCCCCHWTKHKECRQCTKGYEQQMRA